MTRQERYYNSVYRAAKAEGANDVQAHLAASQASLETGYGKSVKGNNHFGIKAGSKYTGKTVSFRTHEYENGRRVNISDRFRAYDGIRGSVRGYMEFMEKNYPKAWNAPDLPTATKNLRNGRYGSYATDPKYDRKLNSIHDRYAHIAVDGMHADQPIPQNAPTPTPNPRTTLASFAPAGTMAEPLTGILSSRVERAPLPAPSSTVLNEAWRGTPADPNALGRGTPGLLSYAPSPQRPDNMRYQGPQGLGGPGGIYVGGAPERGNQDKIAADLAQGDIGPVDPVEVMQPQQVAAPALPAPRTIQDYPVYSPEQPIEAPQQAPQVPSGMHAISGLFGAPQGAMAVSQSNPDISFTSLGNGLVQKTNQYGHQEILNPSDYSHPSTFSPTPDYGVQAPDVQVQPPERGFLSIPEPRTRLGQTVRGGLGGAAGAMAGGLLGPAGAILGGLIGRELAQGRNPLDAFSRQGTTSAFNTSGFAAPDPSLNQFPDAPSKPSGYREGSGPSYREMSSYSPKAADHISRGGAGLF